MFSPHPNVFDVPDTVVPPTEQGCLRQVVLTSPGIQFGSLPNLSAGAEEVSIDAPLATPDADISK